MTDNPDFDALSRKSVQPGSTVEDKKNLYGAVFALPQWHFIPRGEFPDVHPYVAANPQVADGRYMIRAFTDTDRLYLFAQENGLLQPDAGGKDDCLILSLPTETIVDYLEQFIEQGVWGIWFNSDSQSDGFFAPLEQLGAIQQFLNP